MSPIKIMLVGDTHGSIDDIIEKAQIANSLGIQRLVVLGDFGLWWGFQGVEFIDRCNEVMKAGNLQLFALPGNHECHELWNHMVKGAQEAQATAHGWAYVRSNVLLSPKVHDFIWGGKQFVVAGGAVSIDKDWRLEYERQKRKKIWSPNEQLTDEDIDPILTGRFGGVTVDYLLTHDCSNKTPFHDRLKPDMDSQIHRQRIDKVLKHINPKMHFHGHMHTKYDWMNFVGERNGEAVYVKTIGLECNNDYNSWGVLDTETNEFSWPDDFDTAKSLWARGSTEQGKLLELS